MQPKRYWKKFDQPNPRSIKSQMRWMMPASSQELVRCETGELMEILDQM
tara:strand:- start:306 stop:452 length:147 start_codon:yes stop_codon:yes gene_type:complete